MPLHFTKLERKNKTLKICADKSGNAAKAHLNSNLVMTAYYFDERWRIQGTKGEYSLHTQTMWAMW